MTTIIDVTDHPRGQPVELPKRGPIDLRYTESTGCKHNPGRGRISVGLAQIYLEMWGFTVKGRQP